MFITLIIIFAILFIILSIKRLDLALLSLIAFLPSYLIRFDVFNIPSTILELMAVIIALTWIIKTFIPDLKKWKKKNRTPYPFATELIILIIISFLAIVWAHFNIHALSTWKAYFLEPILIFIIILNTFQNKDDWKKIFKSILISILLVSIPAIYQQITGHYIFNEFWANSSHRRVVSWFGYPNAVGLYLAPLTILLFSWLSYTKLHTYRIIIGITILLSIVSIYFAHSEGALIGLIFGLIVLGLLSTKKIRLITIVGTIIISTILVSLPPSRQYIITKATLSDLSGEIRKQQWRETWQMLKNGHIITGAGIDNYQKQTRPYHQEGIFYNRDHIKNFNSLAYRSAEIRAKYWQPTELYLYPHNIFLNFWSELGLFGLLIFIWIFIKFFLTIISIKNKMDKNNRDKYILNGLFASFITIIIHGLVDVPYFKNDLAMMFWILMSILGIFMIKYNKQHENNSSKINSF